LVGLLDGISGCTDGAAGLAVLVCRWDICVRAALATCDTSGLTPQARHAGMFVCLFAVAGSKLRGMGLEKPSMGQIHVAFEFSAGAGVRDRTGLPWGAGEADLVCGEPCAGSGELVVGLE
jgi:hypothetical protein